MFASAAQTSLGYVRSLSCTARFPRAFRALSARFPRLHESELSVPVGDALLEGLLVRRKGELLREHDVVVEQRIDVVRHLDDRRARAPVRNHLEFDTCAQRVRGEC